MARQLASEQGFGDTCFRSGVGAIILYFEEALIMKNPLDSLWGTVISGLILTVVLYVFIKNFLG